jgi:hypothetical protein
MTLFCDNKLLLLAAKATVLTKKDMVAKSEKRERRRYRRRTRMLKKQDCARQLKKLGRGALAMAGPQQPSSLLLSHSGAYSMGTFILQERVTVGIQWSVGTEFLSLFFLEALQRSHSCNIILI